MYKMKTLLSVVFMLYLPILVSAFHQSNIPVSRLITYPSQSLPYASSFVGKQTTTPKSLFASLDDGNKKEPRKLGRKFILALQKTFIKLWLTPRKTITRFKSLSKKGKALMAMQTFILMLLFGSAGRNIYVKHHQFSTGIGGPPIEVPYSNFLDFVEESGTKGSTSPRVDNVRISNERIIYRLTKDATPDEVAKQRVCYTNKVAASPELIESLQKSKIPFSAANRQRTNTLVVAARTAILGFYMLILWRMYKSFSGNSGGSGDVPGKVANKSTLPLASFDDIQGINEAKMEVMELVDTLRNPSKYAILGARAPTGLLLEGPPGEYKQMRMRNVNLFPFYHFYFYVRVLDAIFY
jgi:hypothetical protein